MRSRPSPMLPTMPETRLQHLMYEYDWLANMVTWEDDQRNFHERSIGDLSNGADAVSAERLRPSALYLASNLPTTATPNASFPSGAGWLTPSWEPSVASTPSTTQPPTAPGFFSASRTDLSPSPSAPPSRPTTTAPLTVGPSSATSRTTARRSSCDSTARAVIGSRSFETFSALVASRTFTAPRTTRNSTGNSRGLTATFASSSHATRVGLQTKPCPRSVAQYPS